jgi:hypothetical protein
MSEDMLTAEELSITGYTLGDASKGEMEFFDGQTECGSCNQVIPKGRRIFWSCSMEMECDSYCIACARETAKFRMEFPGPEEAARDV